MTSKTPRALIITYYWPPAGGGGVQRWVKFAKYFREFGIEPVIYTAEDPEYPAIDISLLKEIPDDIEVVRTPIWEPYGFYRQLTGKKKDAKIYSGFISDSKKESIGQKLSVFIRGNFFIPDARKFWIKPSIKYLKKYLKKNPVDIIISTGPPHSMHLIGLGVKKTTGIPWIADFRDPWTNIDFYDQLRLSRYADRKHKSLEKKVLENADRVVTVSPGCVEDFRQLGNRDIELITNGFDPADFTAKDDFDIEFCLTHVGSINSDRNPLLLWEAIEEVLMMDKAFATNFKLKLIGPVDQSVISAINTWPLLKDRTLLIPWQDHADAVKSMMQSQALLLLINHTPNANGILPGKLYEYMGAGRPILSVGPDKGDVLRIMEDSKAGKCVSLGDKPAIQSAIENLFLTSIEVKNTQSGIERFSRRNLAKRYSAIINNVLGGSPNNID